jgi:hypothetical protein
LGVFAVREDFHHPGVVQGLPDFFLAMEAVEENRIAFHLGMRDLEGYGTAGARIRSAENGGHAAAGSETVYPVVIELFPGVDGSLVSARSAESPGDALYGNL